MIKRYNFSLVRLQILTWMRHDIFVRKQLITVDIEVIVQVVGWWENHFIANKFVCMTITRLPANGLANVLIMKSGCGKRVFSEWPQWLAVPNTLGIKKPLSARTLTCSLQASYLHNVTRPSKPWSLFTQIDRDFWSLASISGGPHGSRDPSSKCEFRWR